jgi:hypothetical protein
LRLVTYYADDDPEERYKGRVNQQAVKKRLRQLGAHEEVELRVEWPVWY